MSPVYKLTYFNGRGRAELSRILFAIAGKSFVDHRIQREEWPALKPQTPFGQVPLLEVDGIKIAESRAIERFLAREFGLMGNSNIEAAQVDAIIEHFVDIYLAGRKARETNTLEEYLKNLTPMLASLEKIASASASDFIIGSSLSYADILVWYIFSELSPEKEFQEKLATLLLDLPHLKKIVASVGCLPALVEYLKNRPVTPW